MRKRKLILNTVSSFLYEIVVLICGLILPRIILLNFGSDINGLVYSVTQFLAVISLLDMGVGSVVQSALYKPLATRDEKKINEILSSAQKFFSRLATILIVYTAVLAVVYPLYVKNYGYWPTVMLIVAIAINTFSQYYFGIVNKLFLQADQKNYIPTILQITACILNTISCIVLIKLGANIQFVKLNTSIIYMLQPIGMAIYIKKNYSISKNVQYDGEPIPQKWSGMSQHIASYVMGNTDTIVLTLFSSLKSVSIYNTYYLVVNNIKALIISLTNGVQSLLGDMIAKNEEDKLNESFSQFETAMHIVVTFIFTCTAILVEPFVSIYTSGVTDTNYLVPCFGYLISFANMMHCYRVPYNTLIMAAGHYKQTQISAWIEVILNLTISIVAVIKYGVVGVTVGTLIAMLYRTIYFAWYTSCKILKRSFWFFLKHIFVNGIVIVLSVISTDRLSLENITYVAWFFMALKIAIIVGVISCVVNFFSYRNEVIKILIKGLRSIKRKNEY